MNVEDGNDLFPWEVDEDPAQEASAATSPADPDVHRASPAIDPGLQTVSTAIDPDVQTASTAIGPDVHLASPASEPELASARHDERAADQRDAIDRSQPARERTVAPREYYSISEVCELVDLKPHVLRYWETQFGPLHPSKNRSGNRVYQRKEIRLIMLVKQLLYEEKYTVEGAKAKLDHLRRTGSLQEMGGRALEGETIQMLRTELSHLASILTPPHTA
jgi:DNA-binding transcriptional MerR regulator